MRKILEYLHDAEINTITYEFEKNKLIIIIYTNAFYTENIKTLTLTMSDVSNLEINKKNPWGESNLINEVIIEDEGIHWDIELQSGDVIKFDCAKYFMDESIHTY